MTLITKIMLSYKLLRLDYLKKVEKVPNNQLNQEVVIVMGKKN